MFFSIVSVLLGGGVVLANKGASYECCSGAVCTGVANAQLVNNVLRCAVIGEMTVYHRGGLGRSGITECTANQGSACASINSTSAVVTAADTASCNLNWDYYSCDYRGVRKWVGTCAVVFFFHTRRVLRGTGICCGRADGRQHVLFDGMQSLGVVFSRV